MILAAATATASASAKTFISMRNDVAKSAAIGKRLQVSSAFDFKIPLSIFPRLRLNPVLHQPLTMNLARIFIMKKCHLFLFLLAMLPLAQAVNAGESARQQSLLSGTGWQFAGAGSNSILPEISAPEFAAASWQPVSVPHVFQTRAHYADIMQGWYRREFSVPPEFSGKQLYLVFEGAATIADVFVNGKNLGQHRGAYTRFVFDVTDAVKPGGNNELAVRVDNRPASMADCLPNGNRLYTVWGGLYRKVWLVAADPLHIDLEDYASPGIYITPQNVSAASADLSVKVLVKNSAATAQAAEIRATLLDPSGSEVEVFTGSTNVPADERATVEFTGTVAQPKLWSPAAPNLYHVQVEILHNGKVVDEVTQPTGFRNLVFETASGRVQLNGRPIILAGADLHQEIEAKASAMDDDDFRNNYALMKDLGFNFIRLPHYPHAQLEYDLCDQLGIFCWAENGHSNRDKPGATADRITTELVKQNYNHPAIAVWSVGNESSADVADREVPVVKALDSTRLVVVANMKSTNADFHGINSYPGWYGKADLWNFAKQGYVSETGAGGVTTIHTDYADARFKVDSYEPEEYQQLVAEARFQEQIKENDGSIGMFAWWTMRDFNDVKYKKPIGWNTKGLLTYAGDKKDVYYLYRCFLRPTEPTVHITSQRYFIRNGAVDNGIKAYSSAAKLTLVLNGEIISTLANGSYAQTNGRRVDNVFFWKTPLHTGKNVAEVSDGNGHTDSAVIYFYGANGLPELPVTNPLVTDLQTSNPNNHAYFMDMPAQAQWPVYYDLDSTADNSFDALPAEIAGAKWIALRRVTKPGQETDLSFKLTRPATVFIMATRTDNAPAFLTDAGFKEVSVPDLVWRDNKLMLVPAQLFSRAAAAGETVHLAPADRDAIILLKE
jgi:beta-galactosidase